MDNAAESRFAEKLRCAQKNGVSLYLDGVPATPETIAVNYVCEDSNYMADYVLDSAGILKELRYDKVTEC